jgi:hypothetical protein
MVCDSGLVEESSDVRKRKGMGTLMPALNYFSTAALPVSPANLSYNLTAGLESN